MFIGLIKSFILSNFLWVLLASIVVSGFAGGYAVKIWYKASLASAEKQAQEKREANDEKYRKVSSDIDKLPIGASAERLFLSWSRDAN